jgi:hypothetical protein
MIHSYCLVLFCLLLAFFFSLFIGDHINNKYDNGKGWGQDEKQGIFRNTPCPGGLYHQF